jgi:hypothetical protein
MRPASTADTGQPPAQDQNREASRIGRAFAASPLAAKMISTRVEMGHRSDSITGMPFGPELPKTVDEHVARSGTRRLGHHYGSGGHYHGSRDANSDSKRNPRCSKRRAARQKQTRQNLCFHFLVLLTHCMKAREFPIVSTSILVGNEFRAGRAAPLPVVFSRRGSTPVCAGPLGGRASAMNRP